MDLCAQRGLGVSPFDAWRRRWTEHPTYRAREGTWPIGWVDEGPSARIEGYLGNLAQAYEIDGEPLVAAAMTCWVTAPGRPSQALGLLSRFFHQKGVDLLLNTSANLESGKAFEAFRGARVPTPWFEQVLCWVTNPVGLGHAAWRGRGYPSLPSTSLLEGIGHRTWHLLRRYHGAPADARGASVVRLDRFDDRFDRFWERLRMQTRRLRFVRDRRQLQAHLGHLLESGSGTVLVAERGAEVLGYAVFLRRDSADIGLARAHLVDLQALDDTLWIVPHLFLAGVDRCHRDGVHVVEARGLAADKRALLEGLRPWARAFPRCPFYYKARQAPLAARLSDVALWDPSMIDGDASC